MDKTQRMPLAASVRRHAPWQSTRAVHSCHSRQREWWRRRARSSSFSPNGCPIDQRADKRARHGIPEHQRVVHATTLPDTIRLLSALNAQDVTKLVWSASVRRQAPSALCERVCYGCVLRLNIDLRRIRAAPPSRLRRPPPPQPSPPSARPAQPLPPRTARRRQQRPPA